ncbi:Fic/DOC family protein [Rufibacter immobilis]|uniref:Fic/DOC family protein n=1 Tax=Rufibacter immobilis TaxID=1348778 RepID=UPI0035E60B36
MAKDGFCYEDSGVLINCKNTHDRAELARFENDIAQIKATFLKVGEGIPGHFDADHLKRFHKALFQEVYPWAGETRASRGGFQGVKETAVNLVPQEMRYAPFREIETRLNAVSLQLQKEDFLKGLDADTFSWRAAYFLDQYNHVHAFREGNGRTLQAMFTQLGKEAGYDINFHQADPARYNEARNYALVKPHSPKDNKKNLAPLAAFFKEVSSPSSGKESEVVVGELPQPSAAIIRIEALRELEVTGGRIADRWDIEVKRQVKEIVEDPRNLENHDKRLRLVCKAILEGGVNPNHYLYQDTQRFTRALDQVRYLAAGKEIPAPKASVAERQLLDRQPKDHKEAQNMFIKASKVVSQVLETHGKTMEGDRLRDVARFVSHVPYIGGMNLEHVANALQVSSHIPSLKASSQINDLKNASCILAKSERRQNRGVTGKGLFLDTGEFER